jgi:hypothetical protein
VSKGLIASVAITEARSSVRRGEYFGVVSRSFVAGDVRLTEVEVSPGERLPMHAHEPAFFCLVLSGAHKERFGATERVDRSFSVTCRPGGQPGIQGGRPRQAPRCDYRPPALIVRRDRHRPGSRVRRCATSATTQRHLRHRHRPEWRAARAGTAVLQQDQPARARAGAPSPGLPRHVHEDRAALVERIGRNAAATGETAPAQDRRRRRRIAASSLRPRRLYLCPHESVETVRNDHTHF